MKPDQKPFNSQTTGEMCVRGMLDLLFTQSKTIITLIQLTDGAAARIARCNPLIGKVHH